MANQLGLGNLVQARIWTEDSEQAAVNTVWYIVGAVGASVATDKDCAVFLNTNLAPAYKGLLANPAQYNGVQTQLHDPTPPPAGAARGYLALFAAAFDNSLKGPGTAGAVGLPRQTAGLMSFQSGRAGPVGRGRLYIPFPSDSDNGTNGQPSIGYEGRLASLAAFLAAGLAVSEGGRTATLVRILLHRRNKDGIWPLPSPVLDNSVSGFWATQKRRGDFGRANKSPI